MCRRFSDKCLFLFSTWCICQLNLFSCVLISLCFYSVIICSVCVHVYFMIFSSFLFFLIAFLSCNSFEISAAVTIVGTFFLCKIPVISCKLECLCKTGGCWVGESERMLFVLAAYGHFHWHEGTLTSNRRTPFLSCTLNLLLICFNVLSLCPVYVPLHLSFSHHKWNCTKSFTVLTHFDCSQSFIFLLTFIFIDPTLAKIVNYSPFIRVSRIRCLKKKCLYHNLNIKSALL